MALRYVSGAFIAIMMICGLAIPNTAKAQQHDASLLPPEESDVITVAGCLQLGGDNGDKYVLANPKLGPIDNVADGKCDAAVDDRALRVKHTKEQGINESMLGHWVEINGRLEKETDDDPTNLREIYIRSFRMVPVLPPPVIVHQQSAAPPAQPEPQVFVVPAPAEQPIGTTGTLPQTASSVPAIGLLGLLSFAGAIGFRLHRSRARA